MAGRDQLATLRELHALILRERECARNLAMEELMEVSREKEALLLSLGTLSGEDDETRALAERIRRDNRRNAYFFWSALKWVRESVDFFRKQTVTTGYGAGGGLVSSCGSGMLLSGKV